MPELPEVETVRLGIVRELVGKEITEVFVSYQPILTGDPKRIINTSVTAVRRFGKGLVIDFANGYSMAVHLKMTGQIVLAPEKTPDLPNKHTHVTFLLSNNTYLFYTDIRKFGWLKVMKTDEVLAMPFFKNLGKEPLRDLTEEGLYEVLQRSKAPVKSLLMQQDKVSGIGNIYASEALFVAGIHPQRLASTLNKKEAAKLFAAVEQVLRKAIALGGSSRENFVNTKGEKGSYQHHFLVYGRAGKPCPVCKRLIVQVVIAGRSTFFCPNCQPVV